LGGKKGFDRQVTTRKKKGQKSNAPGICFWKGGENEGDRNLLDRAFDCTQKEALVKEESKGKYPKGN